MAGTSLAMTRKVEVKLCRRRKDLSSLPLRHHGAAHRQGGSLTVRTKPLLVENGQDVVRRLIDLQVDLGQPLIGRERIGDGQQAGTEFIE